MEYTFTLDLVKGNYPGERPVTPDDIEDTINAIRRAADGEQKSLDWVLLLNAAAILGKIRDQI